MENKLKTKIWAVALFFAVTGVVSLLVVLNKNTDVFKGLFSAQQFALQKTAVQAPRETLPILAERIGEPIVTTVAAGNCEPKSTNIANNSLTVGQLLSSTQSLELSSTNRDTPVSIFEFKTKDISSPREICKITLTGYGDATATDLKISAKFVKKVDSGNSVTGNDSTLGTIDDLTFTHTNNQIFKTQLSFPLGNGYRYITHDEFKEVYLYIYANIQDNANDNKKFRLGIEQKSDITSNASEINIPTDGAFGPEFTVKNTPASATNTITMDPNILGTYTVRTQTIVAENQSSNTEIQIPRNKTEFTEIGKFSFKTNYGTTNLLDLNFEVWDSLATGIHRSNQVIKAVKILDGNNLVLTIPTANISTFFSTLINFGTGIQISTTPKILSFQIQPVETLTTGDKYIIKLRNNGSGEASSIGGNNVTQPPESALDLADFKTNPFSVVDAGIKKLSVSLKPTNVGSVEIARNAKGVSLGKIIFKTSAKNVKLKSINFHSFGVADMPFTNIKISPSLQTAGEISSSSGSKPVTDLTDLSARNRNMTGLEVTNLSNVTVPNDNKEHTFYITGDLISGATVDNRTFGISLQNTNDIEATNTVVSGTGSSEIPIAPGEIEMAAVNNGNEFTVKSGATSSTGTLTLTNIVNNISGHTATAADFPLSIENQTVAVTSGVPITTLPAGSYKAISQNSKSTEYTSSGWTGTGCAANGTFTLTAGATVSCSIAYTVITQASTTGTLTLTTVVNNGNGHTATVADFPLSIENQTIAVTSGVPITTLPAGTYKAISRNLKSTEYTSSGWMGAGCGADGTVTIAAATPVSCTITYTANARTDATLKLINYVVGGSAVEADFSVFIDGVQFERNTTVPVLPGAHRVTTSANVQNYTQSEWRGDCATNGDVDAIVGSDKMCHVTWNFVPPAGAPSCEQQGKVTYTGPTVGTVTNGMCISCSITDFTRFGNTCTPPTPQATQTCEQQGKYTYTGPDKPGVRTTGMCIDCSMEVYQSLGGTCTATAMPTPTDSYQPPLAVTPNLRGSARLVRAPEQGNTGPEVAIYFGALAAAQAVLWLRKKKKK